jgi:hypothetical protein
MIKPKKYVDITFLVLLGLLISISIYRHFEGGYVLSVKNYLGFAILLIMVSVKIINPKKEWFLVLRLLILYALNIINFTVEQFNVNMIGIFMLIIYCWINKKMTIQFVKRIFKGSDAEQKQNRDKMINFYYNKFKICDTKEFDQVFSNFSKYPIEAQIALRKIKTEKDKI